MFCLTHGSASYQHCYHKFCPWSPDGQRFVLLAFEPAGSVASVEMIDLDTGVTTRLGQTARWDEHTGAMQHWTDDDAVVFKDSAVIQRRERPGVKIVEASAPDRSCFVPVDASIGDTRGRRWIASVSPRRVSGDRRASGVVLVDPGSGDTELVCSIEHALTRHPRRHDIEHLNLFTKMETYHPNRPLALFNMVNSMRDTTREKTANVFVLCLESAQVSHVGSIAHHPSWHPTEPWIVSFADDPSGRRRIAIDRIGVDGKVDREYLPYFSLTGHPTFDPTGRYVAVDNYDVVPGHVCVEVFELATRQTHRLARFRRQTYDARGLPHTTSATAQYQTARAFFEQNYGKDRAYRIQAHPSWDRTGRWLAFNSDAEGRSRVYLADLAAYGLWPGPGEVSRVQSRVYDDEREAAE